MDKEMDKQVKQLAADFLEFGVQREKRTAGISEGQAGELERRMLELNPGELAAFITELINGLRTAGSEEGWGVYQSLGLLAESDPQAALRIFRENSDFQKDGKLWKILIPEMLVNLASTDPIAAVRWQKEILGIQPDLIGYFTESGMVAAVAEKGLAPAFQMIRELELKNPERAIGSLVKTIRTPEQRTEFVGLFRDFMRTEQGSKSRDMGQVMLYLSEAIGREGADAGGKWISGADLTQNEKQEIAVSVVDSAEGSEKGKWIEWIGENLSGQGKSNAIRIGMSSWTKEDYAAAGNWLVSAPEGPSKQAAAAAFAETVAPYDPDSAVKWAMTLPEGADKRYTLSQIYDGWPQETQEDRAARAEFAAKYGFE